MVIGVFWTLDLPPGIPVGRCWRRLLFTNMDVDGFLLAQMTFNQCVDGDFIVHLGIDTSVRRHLRVPFVTDMDVRAILPIHLSINNDVHGPARPVFRA